MNDIRSEMSHFSIYEKPGSNGTSTYDALCNRATHFGSILAIATLFF